MLCSILAESQLVGEYSGGEGPPAAPERVMTRLSAESRTPAEFEAWLAEIASPGSAHSPLADKRIQGLVDSLRSLRSMSEASPSKG